MFGLGMLHHLSIQSVLLKYCWLLIIRNQHYLHFRHQQPKIKRVKEFLFETKTEERTLGPVLGTPTTISKHLDSSLPAAACLGRQQVMVQSLSFCHPSEGPELSFWLLAWNGPVSALTGILEMTNWTQDLNLFLLSVFHIRQQRINRQSKTEPLYQKNKIIAPVHCSKQPWIHNHEFYYSLVSSKGCQWKINGAITSTIDTV